MKLLYLECSMWPHRKFVPKMSQIVNYVTYEKSYQENNSRAPLSGVGEDWVEIVIPHQVTVIVIIFIIVVIIVVLAVIVMIINILTR